MASELIQKKSAVLFRLFLSITILFFPCTVFACPLIDGLVDFNCDRSLKIAVIGDSIVKGIGDLRFKNRGGYVKRLDQRLKNSKVSGFGLGGYTTDRIFSELKSKLRSNTQNALQKTLIDSDIIIVDAGRNDFFLKLDPVITVKNLKRIVKTLRRGAAKLNRGIQPYVIVATLLPTTRGYQRPFIDAVNQLLFEFTSSDLPVGLFFNQISDEVISQDGLHPTSEGYRIISAFVEETLISTIKDNMLSLRPDEDSDGVFDRFERSIFKTNPNKSDSDSDLLSDGDELFVYLTDPLSADTDLDGTEDGEEVENGSNPLE